MAEDQNVCFQALANEASQAKSSPDYTAPRVERQHKSFLGRVAEYMCQKTRVVNLAATSEKAQSVSYRGSRDRNKEHTF